MGKEEFRNDGTTKREQEVAKLLNKKIPGHIVIGVRFAGWTGSGPSVKGNRLFVSVDLVGGGVVPGGYVGDGMNAKEQAESIYENIATMASGL
jgi:hypothetical protein